MRTIEKLASWVEAEPGSKQARVRVLLQAQLDDGLFIVVLDDRGWSSSEEWAQVTPAGIRETALVVVGPDEPAPGWTRAEELHAYWQYIQSILAAQQLHASIDELMALDHEVQFGPRLQCLLTAAGH
ncbi:hypothetical protein [Glutamicibacter sp. NPDC127525]|uniref:hypothetical protein n=1 Tax=unclassified Glutamicibacter TaxID=2627139 RepID=UPI00364312E6